MKTVLAAALVLAVTSATSFAGTPLINARQNAQSHRIFNGVTSGEISFTEYQKLQQGQTRVQNLEKPGEGRRLRYAVRTGAHPRRAIRSECAHLGEEAQLIECRSCDSRLAPAICLKRDEI
ncbi:hypothetical protein [Bradyrhizobium sp.]|uniref:hypothetical protein n=1 Tax=Bradyrhizobium sp. TaxID=376 RepID=UPI004037975A